MCGNKTICALDILCKFFSCTRDELQQTMRNKDNKNKAAEELRKYRFKASHLESNFVVVPVGLSYTGADRLKIRQDKRYSWVTVALYLRHRYKIQLKYPELLCVLCKSGYGFYYQFPLELLVMIEDSMPDEKLPRDACQETQETES